MTTTVNLTDLAKALIDAGQHKLVPAPWGGHLRYRLEPDYNVSLNDFDCYGKTQWSRRQDRDIWTNGDPRVSIRPDGFDGAARIWSSDGMHDLWWQPPTDWHTLTADVQKKILAVVDEVLRYGFYVLYLEHCVGMDAFKQPIVVNYMTSGGVEPLADDAYLLSVVEDMLHENHQEGGN